MKKIIRVKMPNGLDPADEGADQAWYVKFDQLIKDSIAQAKGQHYTHFKIINGSGAWENEYKWLFPKLIPHESIGFIAGPSASGKTFAVVELAGCLISPRQPFGCFAKPLKQGGVLYCTTEGRQGLAHRFEAWRAANNIDRDLWNSHLFQTGLNFNFKGEKAETLVDLIEELREEYDTKIEMVVFDTFRNYGSIENENDSTDTHRAVEYMRQISELAECAVVGIHHSGKQMVGTALKPGAGFDQILRGSSDLGASAEFVLGVTKAKTDDGDEYNWIWNPKLKDADVHEPVAFEIKSYDLDLPSGKTEHPGVVRYVDGVSAGEIKAPQKPKRKKKADLDAELFIDYIASSDERVHRDCLKGHLKKQVEFEGGDSDTPAFRQRFSRACGVLVEHCEHQIEPKIEMYDNGVFFKAVQKGIK